MLSQPDSNRVGKMNRAHFINFQLRTGQSPVEKQTSDVAIIIVNWNSGELLGRTLDALKAQVVRPKRTIIIDNASSDGSATRIENRYHGVDIIRLDKNTGFAAANNLGARMATDCKWIALLNPDAFPEPEWLGNLLKAAERYPEFSFFSSRMMDADHPTLLDGIGDVYHVSGLVWRKGHGASSGACGRRTRETFSPCAAAALFRTEEFINIGGFDEGYFCYSEDVDLGFRLRLIGRRCLHVDDAVVAHVGSASTERHSDFQIYHGHRNLVWTFIKNMPWPLFWFYLPQHLILNLLTTIVFSLRGKGKIILKAKLDAIKTLPLVLRQRRAIQKTRKARVLALWKVMAKGPLKPYLRR